MLSFPSAIQLLLLALLTRVVYLCYFHPLARYPGPFLARFTNLWFVYHAQFLSSTFYVVYSPRDQQRILFNPSIFS